MLRKKNKLLYYYNLIILIYSSRNIVKTFYTAGLVIDILDQFDTLDDEFKEKRKYAKWKAAYIHNCLKNGEIPVPGSRDQIEEDENGAIVQDPAAIGYSSYRDRTGKYIFPTVLDNG